MANMNRKRTEPIRVPSEVRNQLKNLSFELSALEKNRVSIPDIQRRIFENQEIIDRLKLGSIQRSKRT